MSVSVNWRGSDELRDGVAKAPTDTGLEAGNPAALDGDGREHLERKELVVNTSDEDPCLWLRKKGDGLAKFRPGALALIVDRETDLPAAGSEAAKRLRRGDSVLVRFAADGQTPLNRLVLWDGQGGSGSFRKLPDKLTELEDVNDAIPQSGDLLSYDALEHKWGPTPRSGVGWQPVDATDAVKGLVQLADAAAIMAGLAGRVVDAARLKDAFVDPVFGGRTVVSSSSAVVTALADAATITPDFDVSSNFSVTLGGNRTIANPSNASNAVGQSGSLFIAQDATGGRTASWGANWDWPAGAAPTLSTAANAVDRVDYIVRSATSVQAVFTANYS